MQVVEYLLDPPPPEGVSGRSFQLPECKKSRKMTKMSKMAKTVFFQKITKNLRKIVKKPEISEKNLNNIDTTSKINDIIYQKGSKSGYLLWTGHQK